MDFSFVIPAFFAGILMFLAPCTLPIVPGFLGYISGVSLKDLNDETRAKKLKRKIVLNAAMFVLGFSAVFILLGVAAGAVGSLLGQYRLWFARLGGLFVIAFGCFLLGWLDVPFLRKERQIHLKMFNRGNYFSSLFLGASFAFGWTPCVGPILASILFWASNASTAWAK